ncbi:MAG: CotH kinase family protein [Bacteroidaceae bacterium]|nr:CotH kinase family protein [Bacteroidaceae bacterium]
MKKVALFIALLLALVTKAGAQTWTDVTREFIKNPDYDNDSNEGWTINANAGSTATRCGAQEFWNGTWEIFQTLEGLMPGRYRVSVQAYYRPTDNNDEQMRAGRAGTADKSCILFANSTQTPVTNIYTLECSEWVNGCWMSWGENWSFQAFPNDMESGTYFFQQGEYWNQLETLLPEGGSMVIGIRNPKRQNSNWVLMDNWRLEWIGDEVMPTSLTLDCTEAELNVGEILQLTATVLPENTTFRSVAYSSSDPRVARVDENGQVTALNTGTTTITAQMANGFSDLRATCVITVVRTPIPDGAIILNEVMQANVDMYVDPSFNYGGWAELYNTTDRAISMDGLFVSDDPADLRKMPLDSRHGAIPAHGFLCLWFDHYSRWAPAMVNFKLDADGGTLYLTRDDGTILLQANYPAAISRVSYARTTDGGDTWGYTAEPTPAASNATSHFAAQRLEPPVIDQNGGFFTDAFTAHVEIPQGTTLRYTTNGSTPTLSNGDISRDGKFDIQRTTTLRLRLFQDGKLPSPVVTRSYIYKDKDYSLPVISIVSDNENLYGNELGIFVQGRGNGRPGNGQSSKCNWNMDWDRPVNMEYFTEEGQSVFNQEVGIEAAGGWSRAWTPHSFNIKASKIYEGVNRMEYQFFDDKPFLRHKALKVRNGGNDNNCRIKDAAIQEVVKTSGLNIETQAYKPVHIFENGQYIGVLNLREPNNRNYAFAHYGIDTDTQDQWKMSPDSGYVQQTGTRDSWEELLTLAQSATDPVTYNMIGDLLDIEEFINYLAVELYICGTDWPQNNIKSFRDRNAEGEPNGRFRFVVFDTDGAFATGTPFNTFSDKQWKTFDRLYGVSDLYPNNYIFAEIEFVTLFNRLTQNDEFRKQFIDQFCIVAGSVFEPKRAAEVINAMVRYVTPAMRIEGRSPSNSANEVRNNLSSSRQSSMVENMRSFFRLKSPQTVKLGTNLDEAVLLINGLQVPTGQFSGKLFAPVTVTAAAPAGYRFIGWKKGEVIVCDTESYELPTTGNVSIIATYEPLEASDKQAWDAHPVKINEVSAGNDIFVNDYFKKEDWIELYNTTDAPIDLAGMFLTDNPEKPEKFQIPASDGSFSSIIPAHGHLVLWADKLESLSQLHTGFKLANEEASVILTAQDHSWADTLTYCAHLGSQSVGLFPDGSSNLYVMDRPTIGQANVLTTTAQAWQEPHPEVDDIHVPQQRPATSGILFDLTGRPVRQRSANQRKSNALYIRNGKIIK